MDTTTRHDARAVDGHERLLVELRRAADENAPALGQMVRRLPRPALERVATRLLADDAIRRVLAGEEADGGR